MLILVAVASVFAGASSGTHPNREEPPLSPVHHVGRMDPSLATVPAEFAAHASGLTRQPLVGRAIGAVHTEVSIAHLATGGWVDRHVHAFELAIYVLAGSPVLSLDRRRLRLAAGDYALVPMGMPHAWSNDEGADDARWLAVSTPTRVGDDEDRRDTFFLGDDAETAAIAVETPAFGDPRHRLVGHYEGTPPQAEALAVLDPAVGRRPAGMDTAIIAYSGISVRMMVDRVFGSELLTMFTVDYEPNGAAQVHDHPYEEAYVFLEGEIDAVLDGESHRIRAGDVVFAGVGSAHGFFNTSPGRVRWIETQAPQPPMRHSYRWVDVWKQFEAGLAGETRR